MSQRERLRRKGVAVAASIAVHAALIVLLLFIFIPKAVPQDEDLGGIMVNIGDMIAVQGSMNPEAYLPLEEVAPPTPTEEAAPEEQLLTQEHSDAPALEPRPKKKPVDDEALRRAEIVRQEQIRKKRAEEEARKRQEEIKKNVSGAFGNASRTNGSGESADGATTGKEGSPDGNVERGGVNVGVGGFGSYSLSGRKLVGALPRPSFTAQVEGTIVVQITVDPSGKVISTNLGTGTTISDYAMRQSAMKAARSARFTETDGINNQVGTITYRYRLK